MPFIIPQITYPAILPTTTLSFTYPPVEKPGIDDLDGVRNDSLALCGLRQSMFYRTDTFKHLTMSNVPMIDLPYWKLFFDYAMQGGSFLYYPDATASAYDEWLLESSGGSSPSTASSGADVQDAWSPTFVVRGLAQFELVFRKVPGGLTSP